MKPELRIPLILCCALVFSYLFFEAFPGLNWLIFTTVLIIASYVIDPRRVSRLRILASVGLFLSSLFFVIHASSWMFFVSIVWLGVFSGITAEPHYRSFGVSILHSASNALLSYYEFARELFNSKYGIGRKVSKSLRYYYLAIPLFVIIIFITIYSNASPFFDDYLGVVSAKLNAGWQWLFQKIDISWFWLLVLGVILSVFTLMPTRVKGLLHWEANSKEKLTRLRKRVEISFGRMGLKNEFRSAIILIGVLNALLFLVNILDIYHVWLNFEWNGEYLKQFVHEGTWLLIVSIFISMAVVLYYYRGNLNYYPKNRVLNILTLIWLVQNAFLALSVVVRNLHYIDYFSLAYKRIAVMFFLAAVLYGLYTVYIKVKRRKSVYYLIRKNSMAVLILLLLSTGINWDVFIARYNVSHYKTGYLHFDFLANMNFAAFPYLDHDLETLKEMEELRNQKYPIEPSHMTAEEFYGHMQKKMELFAEKYPERSWKQWNWADAKAFEYVSRREQQQ